MGLRHRSIRLRVGILIAVPVFCLIGLYGFAASITLGNALTQSHARTLRNALLEPLGNFQLKLDAERRLAVLKLANPDSTVAASSLNTAESQTVLALGALTTAIRSARVNAQPHELQAISKLMSDTNNLADIRNAVSASAISISQTLQEYSVITEQGYSVLEAAMFQQASVPLVGQALQVINLDEVAQTGLEESNLLEADIDRGKFPNQDRILFGFLAGYRSQQLASTLPLLDPQYQEMLTSKVPPAMSAQLTSLERTVEDSPWRSGPAPTAITAGLGIFERYSVATGQAITEAADVLQNQAQSQADSVFTQLILAAGFGFIGTVVSIGLSLFIGRSLVRQLRGLRESALGLANEKLPGVITQLREGQPVDLADYAAPGRDDSSDEIEQVQHAFNVVQQTAVKSAIDEARLRRGISDVFRNLAGRSQSLLQRQLTLLDGMERRATEPDELEDLFRIDHLTTRMRRHAEGLIILSGEAPARGWRQPVPLIDVLRAAVAEVEDYTRIRVLARSRAAVAGHAVADVIHLVAELAENATVFSPPNTPVRIQGDVVGKGFAIEIEDRGLGISPDRLAEINSDLANPPQFDLSDSDRLGLFIAGQLARRHDITITLQPSVYGGTTAIVLIPLSLVVDEDSYAPDPALPAGSSATQAGRHAALAGVERGRLTAANGHTLSLVTDSTSEDRSPAASLPAGTLLPPDLVEPEDPIPPAILPTRGQPASPSGTPLPSRGQRIGDHAWLSADPPSGPVDRISPGRMPADPFSQDPFGPDPFRGDEFRSGPVRGDDLPVRAGSDAQFGPGAGAAAQARPGRETRHPAHERPEDRVSAEELAELGLPMRVRQANLAPQLRASGPADIPSDTAAEQAPAPDRAEPTGSPEAARSTMSALQRGWQLGRAADTDVPPAPPAAGEAATPAASEPNGSPEAARSTMSALQRGWQLGRAADTDVPPAPTTGFPTTPTAPPTAGVPTAPPTAGVPTEATASEPTGTTARDSVGSGAGDLGDPADPADPGDSVFRPAADSVFSPATDVFRPAADVFRPAADVFRPAAGSGFRLTPAREPSAADESPSAPDDPRSAVDQPRSAADGPQSAADEFPSAPDDPRSAADQPRSAAPEPPADSADPDSGNQHAND
jgi:signal transduction histidine kinase